MACRCALDSQNALQFTSGDHVKAGTGTFHQSQNGERGIGFDRVAECMWNETESACERLNARPNNSKGINVERSVITLAHPCKRKIFAKKLVRCRPFRVTIGERRRADNLGFPPAL